MDQQTHSGDQQLQQSSQVEADQQTVGEERRGCWNIIKLWRDPIACIKSEDFKSVVRPSNITNNIKRVSGVLKVKIKESYKPVLIALDVGLFIFFLANFIRAIINFGMKQEPLGYNIVCNIISLISLIVSLCKLVYTLLRYRKTCKCRCIMQRTNRIEPNNNREPMAISVEDPIIIEDIENDAPSQDNNTEQPLENESDPDAIGAQLLFSILNEFLLYPAIICSLYGLINEKQWQFDDALAGYSFLLFLYNLYMDALYTKLKYIWIVQKYIISLFHDDEDKNICKLGLASLFITPHVILLALMHWLIIAIIGVRIYVDNFSTEINQAVTSDTGGYTVASYTVYMIICGVYLPVASVIVWFVLNRAYFIGEIDSVCEQMLFFLKDPVAYIVTPFLMAPFIAFCVGIYLPDYDSSEFEVDPDAKRAAEILGLIFIIIFLLCNIRAAVIFGITVVLLGITVAFIVSIIVKIVLIALHLVTCCIPSTNER